MTELLPINRSVSTTLSARSRLLAIVGILLVAAAAAGLMMVRRLRTQDGASSSHPTVTPNPVHPQRVQPPTVPVTTVPVTPRSGTKAALTPPKPDSAAGQTATAPQQPADALPPAVERELAANHVVVVALYDPSAKVDLTALREAQAGAALSSAAFVPVNVTTNAIDGLNKRFGVLQDPAVLVLRPPGDLIVRIDGFADRDTVAQAAANAAQ